MIIYMVTHPPQGELRRETGGGRWGGGAAGWRDATEPRRRSYVFALSLEPVTWIPGALRQRPAETVTLSSQLYRGWPLGGT